MISKRNVRAIVKRSVIKLNQNLKRTKASPTDTHKVTCIDGKVRDKPYKFFDCIHCHWKHWIHYQQKMPYTICDIHSDKKYERDCNHEKNPFECEHFEVKECDT